MAVKFSSTKELTTKPKVLTFGRSGAGKTKLISTAEKPVIISSENKMASLSKYDFPVLQVKTMDDLKDATKEVKKLKKKMCVTGCIDSITDITESFLMMEKKNHSDPRKAYMVVQDEILQFLKEEIRDCDKKFWYVVAKLRRYENDEGIDTYGPKMPGNVMGPELPYIFDEVFAMRIMEDEEKQYRYLQTGLEHDPKYDTKDCSETLNLIEQPNLAKIYNKILKG